MPFDLLTLYYLAIGTLLSSAALTLWECQAQHTRTRSMVILAAGYCTLAMGCALAIVRGQFPGATGAALSNMTMVSGYLMIMNGVASLNGDRHHRLTIGILAGCLAMWAIAGEAWQVEVWTYVSAMPIALVSALTVWAVARNQSLSPLRASRVVMTLAAAHAVFYAGRALALPLLAARFGNVAVEAA